MEDLDRVLKEIEVQFRKNPNGVWEFINRGDLLVTKSKNNHYIIEVEDYVSDKEVIKVNFIYSLRTDTFYNDSGYESTHMVDRYPTNKEIDRLNNNLDYLTYIANK